MEGLLYCKRDIMTPVTPLICHPAEYITDHKFKDKRSNQRELVYYSHWHSRYIWRASLYVKSPYLLHYLNSGHYFIFINEHTLIMQRLYVLYLINCAFIHFLFLLLRCSGCFIFNYNIKCMHKSWCACCKKRKKWAYGTLKLQDGYLFCIICPQISVNTTGKSIYLNWAKLKSNRTLPLHIVHYSTRLQLWGMAD